MKNRIIIIITLLIGSMTLLSMTILSISTQEPREVPSKYEKMENPYAGSCDADNLGRLLYSKHCKSYHGSKGKGDGTKAETLDTEVG